MMDSPDDALQNTNGTAFDPSTSFASEASEAAYHISRTTTRSSTEQPEVVVHDGGGHESAVNGHTANTSPTKPLPSIQKGLPEVPASNPPPEPPNPTNPTPPENPSTTQPSLTDSHALASADHSSKGAAQIHHFDDEAKDLGWGAPAEKIPSPLVGGLSNDELWTLVRRFNKQVYHVKVMPHPPPGNLDLNISEQEEFSPDKLRATFERLYMTIIIGLAGFAKHIARLSSWNEKRRTTIFCVIYFTSWLLNILLPTLLTFLLLLILSPKFRILAFPPLPLSLISSSSGELKKPPAGMLGSKGSLTGAPERHEGEAVEEEASNFVSGLTGIAVASAMGKQSDAPLNERGEPDEEMQGGGGGSGGMGVLGGGGVDPTNMVDHVQDARGSADGGKKVGRDDKTKVPMQEAMWVKARPVMRGLGDVIDTWERFGNALSPTPPFPAYIHRVRLAAIVVGALLASMVLSATIVVKTLELGIGFSVFGQPIVWRGVEWLESHIPNWRVYLDLRNTLLRGVPTNAQLTITLLRIGEVNRAPLPPPPRSDEATGVEGSVTPPTVEELPGEVTEEERDGVVSVDPDHPNFDDGMSVGDGDGEGNAHTSEMAPTKKKHTVGSKIVGFFKGTTKLGVETVRGGDRVRAVAGSEPAKNRLGIMQEPGSKKEMKPPNGPVVFGGRFKGKKGEVWLVESGVSPCVAFTYENKGEVKPVWSIAVNDVRELRKVGGLGWKGKLVVGWSTGRDVADGLEIVDGRGERLFVSALVMRDELFNRLVAIGGQMWESW
ncbi:hypothetical protein JAAARDRAFT_170674 [Jaapia argillacea MUCL 33604]|uniref:Uncharacterized protein n=1 Tax=Jaapia argillacea MUCL 33604 TaxID=933084 RepID=A0A067Q868_9AGAM|nr:hypothetical protein JAAARDRAFT_170674 [Jaapia argillacea MUCL 33604]